MLFFPSFPRKISEVGWCLLFWKNTKLIGVTDNGTDRWESSGIQSSHISQDQIAQNFVVGLEGFNEVGLCACLIQFSLASYFIASAHLHVTHSQGFSPLKLMKVQLQCSSLSWVPVLSRGCCGQEQAGCTQKYFWSITRVLRRRRFSELHRAKPGSISLHSCQHLLFHTLSFGRRSERRRLEL